MILQARYSIPSSSSSKKMFGTRGRVSLPDILATGRNRFRIFLVNWKMRGMDYAFQQNANIIFGGGEIPPEIPKPTYPLVNQHSYGISLFSIGNTSSMSPFFIAMLVYRSVPIRMMYFYGKSIGKYTIFRWILCLGYIPKYKNS